ncbi:hypothetical protein AXI59_06405 [Bacillus nakamurai]|uniref:Uncharacterized protein n=1 Tax=Bacillus nakamurai TaxID=1793963 RepID=A0A150F8F0_9BACI|nr:hypothetical protein [Bacillus nakamurai]KXZ20035.1 hypothetical protein AXI58_15780 [Bacillus nakamurai]KXZ23942.1 hypothetical protein AXI59_06405 [Bacillus nakamurai]MCP6682490.1 hypothetical protein [Bacillus nakamurai]MED1229570.1 hypothetical protein [Bacillus nakamurai]
MNSFLGLLKKDAKLSWIGLAVWLCGMICCALIAHAIAAREKAPLVIFGFFAMMGFFQFLLSPLLMYYHLRKEGKNQLWLYNPNGGFYLLASKLTVSLLYQVIAQLALTGYGIWMYRMLSVKGLFEQQIPLAGTISLLNVYMLISSAYLCVIVAVFWTVFHSLKHFPVLRWVICVVIAAAWSFVDNKIITPFTEMGSQLWPVKVYSDFEFHYVKPIGWTVEMKAVHLSLLEILVVIVLTALFLILASVLLNRKVEV